MEAKFQDQSAEFEGAVVGSFKFLEADHGFERRSSRPHPYSQLVIYESRELYVILSFGAPAYEPEMSFDRRGIDDVPGAYNFHAGDLVKLDNCETWISNREYDNTLASWVSWLARLFESYGAQCLAGEPSVFGEMKSRRDALVTAWKHDEKLKVVRAQIEAAWQEKDYQQVLRLYESVCDLSKTDNKRIAIASARA